MGLLSAIRSRYFILNVMGALAFVALLVWGVLIWLKSYTQHEVKVLVPALAGYTIDEADAVLDERDLLWEVIDSVYSDKVARGTVFDQDPRSGQEVKPGRKVYLTMNANEAKIIGMPDLVNLSKRQAISILQIVGLGVGEVQYRADPCTDCVVAQLYKGKAIGKDAPIKQGESVVLVLGKGRTGESAVIPDLYGLQYAELNEILGLASLNLGAVVICEGCNTKEDSSLARVYRQSPTASVGSHMQLGGVIDVWLTTREIGNSPTPPPTNNGPAQETPESTN